MSAPMVPMGPGAAPAPMMIGQMLDRIWQILRRNVKLFTAIGSVPMLVGMVALGGCFGILVLAGAFPMTGKPPDPNRIAWTMIPAFLIAGIPCTIVFAVFQAAACQAAIAVYRGGEVTCRTAYRAALSKTGRYVWLLVLCWVLISLPFLAVFAVLGISAALIGSGQNNPGAWFVLMPLIILLYVGGMVYAIWMSLRVGLAYPASVAEDLTAVQALERSAKLTRNAKGRMFLVMVVVYAISYVAIIVMEMVAMAGGAVLALIGSAMHVEAHRALMIGSISVGVLVFLAAILLWSALIYAAYAIALTVLYEDQVVRIDGAAMAPATGGLGL